MPWTANDIAANEDALQQAFSELGLLPGASGSDAAIVNGVPVAGAGANPLPVPTLGSEPAPVDTPRFPLRAAGGIAARMAGGAAGMIGGGAVGGIPGAIAGGALGSAGAGQAYDAAADLALGTNERAPILSEDTARDAFFGALPGLARPVGQAVGSAVRTAARYPVSTGAVAAGAGTVATGAQTQSPASQTTPRARTDYPKLLNEQRATLAGFEQANKDDAARLNALTGQRAAAAQEMRDQNSGAGGRKAGVGPAFIASQANLQATDAQIKTINERMAERQRLIGETNAAIADTTRRMTPEYQRDQDQIDRAQAELTRALGEVRQPWEQAHPWLARSWWMVPGALGLLGGTLMRGAALSGEKQLARTWQQAADAAGNQALPQTERDLALARAQGYANRAAAVESGWFPKTRDVAGWYGPPLVSGAVGGGLSANLPRFYDFNLPLTNQVREAWQNYLMALPQGPNAAGEREHAQAIIGQLNPENTAQRAARDYFTSVGGVGMGTLEGAGEGIAGAEFPTMVTHPFRPNLTRQGVETESLASARGGNPLPPTGPTGPTGPAPGLPGPQMPTGTPAPANPAPARLPPGPAAATGPQDAAPSPVPQGPGLTAPQGIVPAASAPAPSSPALPAPPPGLQFPVPGTNAQISYGTPTYTPPGLAQLGNGRRPAAANLEPAPPPQPTGLPAEMQDYPRLIDLEYRRRNPGPFEGGHWVPPDARPRAGERETWVSPQGNKEKFKDSAGRWQDSDGWTTPPRSGWRRISLDDRIGMFGGYPVG